MRLIDAIVLALLTFLAGMGAGVQKARPAVEIGAEAR